MKVPVKKVEGTILKIQRIVYASKKKALLIYTEDGQVLPTIIPDEGTFSQALGDRRKAYFICTVDGQQKIRLGNEIYKSE